MSLTKTLAIYTHFYPFNSFPSVFFLFLFENQLNEQLLEFFIAVVDAELFKSIAVKNFKTVNVQHTNYCAPSMANVFHLHGTIDLTYNPSKEPVVHCLHKNHNEKEYNTCIILIVQKRKIKVHKCIPFFQLTKSRSLITKQDFLQTTLRPEYDSRPCSMSYQVEPSRKLFNFNDGTVSR